jgi:hypothetical protein
MQEDRRALYNSLRMNWLQDSTLDVEPWQVEDYRALESDVIFQRLAEKQIFLDKPSFQLYAENVDSPEDLNEELISESDFDNPTQDEVYLLVFELWRRFVTEKKSLSIFLDELDHQIYLYDNGQLKNSEALQDNLEELSLILDENIDSGIDPSSIFESISASCANDIESFLYDFISEQIDNENYLYATELLDDFSDYIPEIKWFDFLRARIQGDNDTISANQTIRTLMHKHAKDDDLEFNLELLSFVSKSGEHDLFINLVKKSIPLLQFEEDFIDLILLCIEYFERLDHDSQKQALEKILESRSNILPETKFLPKDRQITEFLKICEIY